MPEEISSALRGGLVLLVIFIALALMVAGRKGLRDLSRSCGRGLSDLMVWLLGTLWRLAFMAVTTMVDLVITLAVMAYHMATVHRTDMLADDVAAFLQRLTNRLERVFTR